MQTLTPEKKYGLKVRVKREIEELVREIADLLGFQPYTIRNYAILLGLQVILLNPNIPRSDRAFEEVLEKVRRGIKVLVGENG